MNESEQSEQMSESERGSVTESNKLISSSQ